MKHLAIGSGILVLSILAPLSAPKLVQSIIRNYFRKKRFERARFLKDIKSLQSRELIDYKDLGNGTIKIVLTKQGKEKMLLYQIDEIKLDISGRWDGEWRLVMFDVPHQFKAGRDALRKKLLDLKCYPIQKSVFITPYSCEDEVDFIASVFNVRKYVLILYVSHFEGEEKLKHYFKL